MDESNAFRTKIYFAPRSAFPFLSSKGEILEWNFEDRLLNDTPIESIIYPTNRLNHTMNHTWTNNKIDLLERRIF